MISSADQLAIIAAHPAKVTATLPSTQTVDGIFTKPTRVVNMYDGGVSSTDPSLTVSGSDRTTHELEIGGWLTVNEVNYCIVDLDERNDGFVRLGLQKEQQS